jgi:hypothetical protein
MSEEHNFFWTARVKESIEWVLVDRDKCSPLSIVYILRCCDTGRVKIGITQNLDQRVKEIQAMSPTELNVVCSFIVEGQDVERFFHRLFDKYRLHGEWFEIPSSEFLGIHELEEELSKLLKQTQDERRNILEEKYRLEREKKEKEKEDEVLF